MTASADNSLNDLGHRRPEWEPWLAVVQEVLRETADTKWDALVPVRAAPPGNKVPLLAGGSITLDASAVRGYVERLIGTACRGGTEKMATLKPALSGSIDIAALFKASLCQNGERLKEIAIGLGADPEAFQAVVSFVPVPFLHACNRAWAPSIAPSWTEGYCPVCSAWPAFAEVRGIERSRHFRCGRCAGQWQVNCLTCPYCGMTDHKELVSLVPEKDGASRVIDACKRCLGYVKTFTVLQGCPPERVILNDLASVDLDVAALQQGYKRPDGPGYVIDVTLVDKTSASGKFFSWIK
jgi:FdhE protein